VRCGAHPRRTYETRQPSRQPLDRQAGGQGATIQKDLRLAHPYPDPGQNRSIFLRNHAHLIWAYAFLPILDLFFRPVYAFFIIELGSRQVVHFRVISHATDAWVPQLLREATPYGQAPRLLIRDRDSRFGEAFARVAKASSWETRVPGCPSTKGGEAVNRRVFLSVLAVLAMGAVTVPACLWRPHSAPPAPPGSPAPEVESARRSLATFLELLHGDRFDLAAEIYSGPLDLLRTLNPSIPPNDLGDLLRGACQSGRLRCLAPRSETLRQAPYSTEWLFAVQSTTPDGSLSVKGPCCGASRPEAPSQSQYLFRVVKANGARYAVLDLPPLVP
jgi:hypothetical protein